MNYKNVAAYTLKADSQQGIVEAIVAVMGNDDQGNDVIHPGAFNESIQARRGKIKVLDQHNTDSILRVIGKPLEIREIGRDQLPADLLARYPMATGGLFTRTQYLLSTPEGAGAFQRIAEGVIGEYSIGYDPIEVDYSSIVGSDGQKKTVRNLRKIRLWEYSPVLYAMNDATQTVSAKAWSDSDINRLARDIDDLQARMRAERQHEIKELIDPDRAWLNAKRWPSRWAR